MDDEREFYRNILRNRENVENVFVGNVEVEDACEKGGNFVSVVQRVRIYARIENRDFETSVIVKKPSDSPMAKLFEMDKLFPNEIIFYKEIVELLQRYSKHMLDLPKCLYIENFFVYEDLKELGFELKPKGHRFSISEAKLVLKEIVKLHSASLILEKNESKTIQCLDKKLHQFLNRSGNENLEKCFIDHLNIAINIFDELKNFEVAFLLKSLKVDIYQKLLDILETPSDIKVFNHGDLWGNNIFFMGDNLKFIDFQMISYNSPALDLSYFLWVNVEPINRRENLSELLAFYVENLRAFSMDNNLDQKVVDKMTTKWIQNEMRRFSLYGLIYSFLFMPVFFLNPDDFMLETEEYESGEEKIGKLMNETYKKTLINSVLEYVDSQKLYRVSGNDVYNRRPQVPWPKI